MPENSALVALLRTQCLPWNAVAEQVEEQRSAEAVLEQVLSDSPRAGRPHQPRLFSDQRAERAELVERAELLERAAEDIARWHAQGMELITVLDPDYPENLRAVHDRPPLIFVAGRLDRADTRSLAVVGARQATAGGTRQAREIAEHLVDHRYTVVSGLAAGIDTAAHSAALARGGRTLAVIGTGLTRCYPPQNAALQRKLAADCAVISQFWPDAPPSRRSFPMRNAVMSGLTLATVVVEASQTSGARLQARLALGQGRPVFLLESLLEQEWAKEYAARPGTHVVSTPDEITAAVERLTSVQTLVA